MGITKKEKNTNRIRILGIILSFIGLILLFVSNHYAERLLEFNEYKFEIQTDPDKEDLQLQDFQVYYNFLTYKGKILFRMTGTNAVDRIIFKLPKEIKKVELNWTNKDSKYDEDYIIYKNNSHFLQYNYLINYPTQFNVELRNLNKEQKEYSSILILNFEGKLYPSARFEFIPTTGRVVPPGGIENGAFFKFNLGDKYVCTITPCYESFRENEVVFHHIGNDLAVSTLRISGRWKDVDYHIFNLNFNKEINEKFSNFRDFSYLLISLGFIPLIEFLILGYYNIKK